MSDSQKRNVEQKTLNRTRKRKRSAQLEPLRFTKNEEKCIMDIPIILVNPPSPFLIDELVFPPLGLLYLASYLKQNGYNNIKVFDDFRKEGTDSPDFRSKGYIYCITATTPQFQGAQQIINRIRKSNKRARIIIGGPHVSGVPQDGLQAGADTVIVGEGERAIIRALEGQRGIIQEPYIKDINTLPTPARDLIDLKKYKYYIGDKLVTTVMTTRGCPYRCAFCANNVWNFERKIRFHSPNYIYKEVKELKEKYGYNAIMFFDDTFTVDKKRLLEICRLLKPLNITWRCFIRTDTVDKESLKAMYSAGCRYIGCGVESGSPKILKNIHKATNVELNTSIVKLAKKIGFHVKTFIMIGCPGETESTVEETKDWIKKALPHDFDICILTPYAGSDLYEHPSNYDLCFISNSLGWYKGKVGEYKSYVWTKDLSRKRIVELRDEIEKMKEILPQWKEMKPQ